MQLLRVGLVVSVLASWATADDWPQWRGPTRDGVWRETGLVDRFAGERLEPLWRAAIGPGYSGPTVAQGRVYVTDRQTEPQPVERVLCFDAATGRPLWSHAYECRYSGVGYPAGPRACVTVTDGRAYSLGAMGHVFCFDAADGRVLWQRALHTDYRIDMPIWGVSASPLLVGELLVLHIGGSEGACIVALDRRTGQEKWKALDERGQYATPVLVEQAGRPIVVCWTGDSVSGLAAETGRVEWRVPWRPRNMPIGVATPVLDRDRLFLTSFYDGSLLLRLKATEPAVEKIWQRVGRSERETDALHSIISTPVVLGEHIYGVDSYGELRCLDVATGDRVWENLSAVPKARWSTIHFVRNGERMWMFNERGELLIGRLSPSGFEELSRTKLLEPTLEQLRQRGGVCWSHPAFANRCIYARNDRELVCVSLAK